MAKKKTRNTNGYRITANHDGKRVVISGVSDTRTDAQDHASDINHFYPGSNARVVNNSEKIQKRAQRGI